MVASVIPRQPPGLMAYLKVFEEEECLKEQVLGWGEER